MSKLTADIVRDLVNYDPETGVFTRRSSPRAKKIGRVIGSLTKKGYLKAWVYDGAYQLHRVAWLYMTGAWPAEQIDHINHLRADNRWVNLRECTNAENRQNIVPQGYGVSGYLGVSPVGEKWVANISLKGSTWYLGVFDTPEEASQVYLSAKENLHRFKYTGVSVLKELN